MAEATIPNQTPYRLRGAGWTLQTSQAPELLIDGPAGTGKTLAVLLKAWRFAAEYDDCRVLLIRKTRASMTQTILVTLERDILRKVGLSGGASRQHRASYLLANGSEVVIGGLDNVERIMSSEYDLIIVFEATEITEDEWEMLLTRLRNNKAPYQQAIAECNPGGPRHWVLQRSLTGHMERMPSRHCDNPSLTPEYMETLGRLTGHRRSRLLLGLWTAPEGLVFPDFGACFVEPYQPPLGRLVGGMDFGFTAPFAALAATVYNDDDGREQIYVWYERYRSKTLLAQHAKALPREVFWFADPSEPDSIVELRRAGHTVRKATNAILVGIDAVNARISSGTLRIANTCTALLAEVQSYRYPSNKVTETPMKEMDHAMDALRYLIMGVDRRRVAARPQDAA